LGSIQFEHPKAGVVFDTDGPMAVGSRQDIFARAAVSHAIIAAAHIPVIFMLEKSGEGFVPKPVKVD
jgi:hypothetical protein